MADYPRDLVGYGAMPPHAQWPGGAQIAVQFVMNYELRRRRRERDLPRRPGRGSVSE